MNLSDLDPRKAKIATALKWILGLLAAAVIAPFIFLAIKGLIGLAVAAIIGLAIVNFMPVLSMKMANWKLFAMKGEARSRPIETRQKQAIEARERIQQAEVALTEFSAEVKNFADMVSNLPPEDAKDFATQLTDLRRLLKFKQDALRTTRDRTEEFEAATARAARKWKVAQAGMRMSKFLGAKSDDALNKILAEEALDSVQTAMNRALAELETAAAMASGDAPALTHQPADVIEMAAVGARVGVRS